MTITWLGQSAFVIKTCSGMVLLMDPINPATGYSIPKIDNVDVVTMSHEHQDHAYSPLALGNPLLLHGLAGDQFAEINKIIRGVHIRTLPAFHDAANGNQRGKNALFLLQDENLSLVHLGDLGHSLTKEQAAQIGKADILMIPVGGFYTIDGKTAAEICKQLNPAIVIPMHYKTPKLSPFLSGKLSGLNVFLEAMGKSVPVLEQNSTITVSLSQLPKTMSVFCMEYAAK